MTQATAHTNNTHICCDGADGDMKVLHKCSEMDNRVSETYKAPEEMQQSIFIGPAAGGGLLG